MSKPAKLKVLFAAIMLALLMVSCNFLGGEPVQNPDYSLTSEEIGSIREGDIILRQGHGVVSQSILEILKEDIPVSHVGIIRKNPDGSFGVIHTVSQRLPGYDGIQQQCLEEFISESVSQSLMVVRYKGFSENTRLRKKAGRLAAEYLERDIPFDHSFNLEDSTRFFCSELIWRIILEVSGDDIFEKMNKELRRERLKFESFFDPERFELIINHQGIQDLPSSAAL